MIMRGKRTKILAGLFISFILLGSIAGAEAIQNTITINPVGTLNIGDLLVVSGTTTLPAGSDMMMVIVPYPSCKGSCSGTAGDLRIRRGPDNHDSWSTAIDTSGFGEGEYKVTLTNILSNTRDDFRLGETTADLNFSMSGPALAENVIPDADQDITDGNITLDAIGTKHAGDKFLVQGSTTLPVGTDLLWDISPDLSGITSQYTGEYTYITSNSGVRNRKDGSHGVSYAIDSTDFRPGTYNITCSISRGNLSAGEFIPGDIKGFTKFTVIP